MTQLNVLIIEDSADDLELILRELRRGYAVTHRQIQTSSELREALQEKQWDLVLSDYRLPGFDAPAALKICRKIAGDIPFIVISGTIGEDLAVQLMRDGAHDFVMKNAMRRLLAAIGRELSEVKIRLERRRAEEALKESEARIEFLIEQMPAILWSTDTNLVITSSLGAGLTSLNLKPNETVGMRLQDYFQTADPNFYPVVVHRQALEGKSTTFEQEWQGKFFQAYLGPLRREGGIVGCIGVAFDITARKKSEESSSYLAAIVNSSDDAIVGKTLNGTIVSWNPAAERIYGYSASEVVGKSILILFPEQIKDELTKILQKVTKGESVDHYETVRVRKDGKQIYINLTVSSIRNSSGAIIGASAIEQDITEYKRVRDELARQAQELAQFAYVASHDLKEPLRVVASYLQLLEKKYEGRLDDEARSYISRAVNGAIRMNQLVEDILSFSRVGRDRSLKKIDCSAILNTVIDNLKSIIEENKAEITAGPLPEIVMAETELVQLFQNLISNALKFRSQESPRIQVSATKKNGNWTFSVKDNGIGISPEYSERIFRVFQRLHTKEEYPGTGIGLAICKKIAESYGGQIWVESELGKGSTFYFTIPDKRGGSK